MRNLLTASRRRYAVAFVVAAASLGLVAACNPTKKEPPPPKVALLTIAPNEVGYTSQGQTVEFTVTNLGPEASLPLHTGIFGGSSSPSEFVIVEDNCVTKALVNRDNCTIKVQHFGDAGAHHDTFLQVSSGNSQQGGVSAHLVGH